MATQDNNDRKETTPVPSSSSNKAENTKRETADGKTEHTYDPVGMAGQKAGIVEEMEQKLRQEGGEKGKDSSTK